MAEFTDREHYIPLRKSDLIDLLAHDPKLPIEQRQTFLRFSRQITALYHYEYLQQLEQLKDAYAPFDPDTETLPLKPPSPDQKQKSLAHLFERFTALMQRGNFKQLSWKDVEAAMAGGSTDWGINMDVDPKVFERIELFVRGDNASIRTRRSWRKWWKKEEVKVASYQRLVFIVKLQPHRRLGKNIDTENVYVKVFKDIPKLDMEMLLPGARVQWPTGKRVTFWGLLATNLSYLLVSLGPKLMVVGLALASGFEALQRDFSTAWKRLTEAAVLGPVAILGGFSFRQYSAYKTTRQNYALMLAESLYYQNLDNNAGVLTRLLDEAEEQECREVLLGYYCLWKYAPPQGWTSGQLDDYVEMYLEEKANLKVDFEIGDALDKLERLQLVHKSEESYRAVPLDQAVALLDSRWTSLFQS